jgi:signal transduction protein with GAF and PtsI domain
MQSEQNFLVHLSTLEKPVAMPAPSRTIHECLDHVWQRFRVRARLFLLEGDALVLRYCAGAYCVCPEIGLKVNPGSMVWEIFQKGTPVNLNQSWEHQDWVHSLPEPVNYKAVIPLKCTDALPCEGSSSLGVLVVDEGDPCKPIDERDFHYLNLVGMLLSEVLARSMLIESIRAMQREKTEMAEEVAHIFRNRFTVIGRFALRLTKALEDSTLRQYSRIILKETAKGEKALKRWNKLHRKGKEEDEPGYLC